MKNRWPKRIIVCNKGFPYVPSRGKFLQMYSKPLGYVGDFVLNLKLPHKIGMQCDDGDTQKYRLILERVD